MADIRVSELPPITSATNDDVFIINNGDLVTNKITWENLKNSLGDFTAPISFFAGSATTPGITFSSDLNNGIYSPGIDQIAFTTNGTQRLYIDAAGRVGIGNSAPGDLNAVADNLVVGALSGDNGLTIASGTSDLGTIAFADGDGASDEAIGRIVYDHTDNHLRFQTNNSEKVRITADGNLGVGTQSPSDIIHASTGSSGVGSGVAGISGITVETLSTQNAGVQFHTANNRTAGFYFVDPEATNAGTFIFDHSTNEMAFGIAGQDRVAIDANNVTFTDSAGNQIALINSATGLRVGPGAPTAAPISVSSTITGVSSAKGIDLAVTLGADVTTEYTTFDSSITTAASSFNLATGNHFKATDGTIGAGSSISTQYGYFVDIASGSTNYGFYSDMDDAGDYQFYANGNSPNHFNGSTFTIANGGTTALTVTGGTVSANTIDIASGDIETLTGLTANITTSVTSAEFIGDLTGTADNAQLLDNLDSTQFLRSDQNDTTTGNITISNTDPGLNLVDSALGDDFLVGNDDGTFRVRNTTDIRDDLTIDGTGVATFTGNLNVGSGLDVTGSITVTGLIDGRDVAADGSKLDGIEIGATADQTAAEILTAIKTVDGSTSGLDADMVDGLHSDSFLRSDVADIKTSGDLTFNDGISATFGTDGDMTISHSGTEANITNTTGELHIHGDNIRLKNGVDTADFAVFIEGGSSSIYHNNSKKIETSATGATVTGTLSSTGVTATNGNITNITATDITTTDLTVTGTMTIPGTISGTTTSDSVTANTLTVNEDSTMKGDLEITGTHTGSNGDLTVAGTIFGDLTGAVTGNASTATTLQTARNIGGVSFDGSADINLPGVNLTGNQDTTGTATNATNVNVLTDSASNDARYPLFASATTGNTRIRADEQFSYNPSTNTISVDTFDGDLTGNAATATNADSATTASNANYATSAGSATNSTNSENVQVDADNTTNAEHYITFSGGATGNQRLNSDTGLTYNPSTNTLTVANISGSINSATNINVASDGADATHYVGFFDSATGLQQAKSDGGLTYNPSSNILTAGTFSGSGASLTSLNATNISSGTIDDARLPATISSDITGNAATATSATSATTATNANNINISATASTDTTTSVVLVGDSSTGNQSPFIDSGLTYNASSNTLSAGTFSGTLSGNGSSVTSINAGNISSGTIDDARLPASISSDITGNAATATTLATARTINGVSFNGSANITIESYVEDDAGTNATRYLTFVDNSTAGFKRLNEDANLSYNPSTNTLTTTTFSGALSGNATSATTAGTATTLATARNINGVSFNGSSNIVVEPYIDNDESSNATRYLTFVDNSTAGYKRLSEDSSLSYNPSSNTLTAGTFSGAHSGNGSGLTNLSSSALTGTISDSLLPSSISSDITGNAASATTASAADNAGLLDNLDSSQFLRSDAADQKTSGTLRFNDNVVLSLGTSDDAELFCNGSHLYLDLNTGIGNFYIRDGSTTRFTFDDAGDFTATGNVTAYSDIRLKEDIELIGNAVGKVQSLRGVTYTRKDSGERHTGVIAQEVEQVLPEAVIDGDEYKSVAYGNMVGLLIEAIKEQQETINSLTKRVEELEG